MADDFGLVLNADGTVTRKPIPLVEAVPEFVDGVASHDIVCSGVPARVFIPEAGKDRKLPLLIFFHGGGFVVLSAKSQIFKSFGESLAIKLGVVLLSVDYRLAPEHRLPAAYEDATQVVEYLESDPGDLLNRYANLSSCFITGDSAGGNIAYTLAATKAQSLKRLKLRGLLLVQPFFGSVSRAQSELDFNGVILTREMNDMCWSFALPAGSDRDHPFCNHAKALRESPELLAALQLPDTLFVVGGRDYLRSRQVELAELLQQAGKPIFVSEFENAGHAFYVGTPSDDVSRFFDVLAAFIKERVPPADTDA